MKETKKTIENGKSVFNAGMNQPGLKDTKQHPEMTANDMDDKTTWEKAVYAAMQEVATEKAVTAVKVSDVRAHLKDIAIWLQGIEDANERINEANRKALLIAAVKAFKAYPFASVKEKELARRKAVTRWHNTTGFTMTFQAESDETTTSAYEDGAYFSRPTGQYSATTIRTSFNSCELMKRTAAMILAKKEAERKANEAREYLAKQDAARILANLTPSQLAALVVKIKA
mgnify:CR=1 FL=1